MPELNPFAKTIKSLKNELESDETTKGLFVIDVSNKNRKLICIKDSQYLIGGRACHYEISIDRVPGKFTIEIHFEGKDKRILEHSFALFDNLPKGLNVTKLFKDRDCIRYGEGIPSDDPNLVAELKNQLVFMEKNIGDKLREIILANKTKSINPRFPLNQILFGPPGTGKTYNTINKALEITGENLDGKTREEIKKLFDEKVYEGQIVFTTFHQSMSYEDFIEGIKPLKPDISEGLVKYDVIPGVFKSLCRKAEFPTSRSFDNAYNQLLTDLEEKGEIELQAKKETFTIDISPNGNDLIVKSNTYINKIYKESLDYVSKSNKFVGLWGQFYKSIFQYLKEKYSYEESEIVEYKNFVLIIDEINRGNVSQIFGELITLIEEDKRQGNSETLEVVLPYSKEKFSVPSNLYIIGTMNTADRSVEAIDTALRRRFSFEEISPRYDLEELQYDFAGAKICDILQTLNTRIEKLLDKDHQIGHSYFMLKNGEKAEEKLTTSFYKNIIPLLQEYFFGDFGKIGLVLGKGFVKKKEWHRNTDSFADFDYLSVSDFDEREVFEIIDYRQIELNLSLKINNTLIEMNFQKAIKLLMKSNIE